jgi:hypothetical protein
LLRRQGGPALSGWPAGRLRVSARGRRRVSARGWVARGTLGTLGALGALSAAVGRPRGLLGGRWRRVRGEDGRASLGRSSTCGRISATHAGDGLARIPRVALAVHVCWYPSCRGPVGPHVARVRALGAHVCLAGRRAGREGLDGHALAALAIVGEVVLDSGLQRLGARHGGLSARGQLRHQAGRRWAGEGALLGKMSSGGRVSISINDGRPRGDRLRLRLRQQLSQGAHVCTG